MRFQLILASVKSDITDKVVDGAKAAGATGATIITARGTGLREAKTFFGLSLEAQTDIIMFLVEEHVLQPILDAIGTIGEFHKPGTGIAFVLPVDQVIGLESQIERFKEEARKKYF
ncbi:P-II family nitrogen regulator [Desulfotalea psychrophila]|uniref:Related to nitrogen regulatory protein P-II family proteins n=1 Tax=Desulfotalea psychrophila (strain LSv54 / DSM 12343) TaxID=177439 RepID=Q6ARE6_DESPS|nr:P-II family nitrogen regulator [Desulfotalea psychrophila]CAG35078.1 related to nitrogen regulatory protein P-II family proteins [Desulfotalea psychrophila LSv54]